ncbi:amino acid adenylation domain-containing protein [Pseudoalteromonas sp. ASV78]|uniref:amino acid adenylation domain-containing protein n=1 Tax=Pseudoalteromonas sp. ASV78 TaxID=3397851 RepID=UPI0039FC8D18
MKAAVFLKHLNDKGIKLFLSKDGKLKSQAAAGAINEQIASEIREKKNDIVNFLSAEQAIPHISAEHYQLSFSQQRLWFLDKLEGQTSTYNISIAYELVGELKVKAFESALNALLNANPTLLAEFFEEDGQAYQKFQTGVKLELQLVDVEDSSEEQLSHLLTKEAQGTFKLGTTPLVRVLVYLKSELASTVQLTFHHIAVDGWSIELLFEQLAALYQARLSGSQLDVVAEESNVGFNYGDFSRWEQSYFEAGGFEASLKYWTNRLANIPVLHDLPADKNRPRKLGTSGDTQIHTIDADVWKAVTALAKSCQVTPYVFLLTAWGTFLQKLSNQQEIVIATPVLGRTRKGLGDLVGMFVNTLPIRITTDFSLNFKKALSEVKHFVMEDFQHDEVPFDLIVEQLGLSRSLSFSPLTQILFSYQEAYPKALTLAGLESSSRLINTGTAKFELSLEVTQTQESANFLWEFNTDLFSSSQISQWSEAFFYYLNQLTLHVDQAIADIKVISPSEYDYLTRQLNQVREDYVNDRCLHQIFEYHAQNTPDAIAVVFEGQRLSYMELNAQANQLARYLREYRKVKTNGLVGLCLERSIEVVVGILAILKAGGAYVPLDPDYPDARLQYLLEDAALDIVITHSDLVSRTPIIDSQAVCLNEQGLKQQLSHHSSQNLSDLDIKPSDLAYVIYTSGTTGKPKGVLQTHENAARLLFTVEMDFNFSGSDVWVLFHSISFDFSVWELWGGLLYGGKLVIPNYVCTRDPQLFAELCRKQRVTVLNQTPSAFSSLSELILKKNIALNDIRIIAFGGEPLSVESLMPWWDKFGEQHALFNLYGITETAVISTYKRLSKTNLTPISIGHKLNDQTIYLLDKYKNLVPKGSVGEIYVGGAGLAKGYLNKAELTLESFIPDPFSSLKGARLYKSGDLARYLDNGELEFIGRADDQVKVRGFRIELGEIEHQLSECDEVDSCLVLVKGDCADEKFIVAYVKPTVYCDKQEYKLETVKKIKSTIGLALPDYMQPSSIILIKEWPRTTNGKVDKRALPEPQDLVLLPTSHHEYRAPETDNENLLISACAQVLKVQPEQISILANFFELGGHSLLVVKLVSIIQKQDKELSVQSVFSAANMIELAESINNSNESHSYQVPANGIPENTQLITPEMLTLCNMSQVEIDYVANQLPGGVVSIKDIYPLTPLQEGMLYHHMLSPENDTYIVTTYFRLENHVAVEKLIAGLNFIIQRHDVLRTAFFWEQLENPVQVVLKSAEIPVEWIEVSKGQDALEILKQGKLFCMDLARAPLFHMGVANTHMEEFIVRLSWHHLVNDHTSLHIILDELLAWFKTDVKGLSTPVPYREAVGQIQHYQQNTDVNSYFTSVLKDISEPTAPFNLANISQKIETAELTAELSSELSAQIRQWASENQCSPSAFFHTVWALVVAACCSKEQVVFGTVMSGRLQGANWSEKTMGLLINTLPIKASVNNQSLLSLVKNISTSIQELIAYEYTPLNLAQNCSNIEGDAPLFTSIINCRNGFESHPALGSGNAFTFLEAQERTNYPLGVSIDDFEKVFHFTLNVDSSVNAERVMSYVVTASERLMTALLQSPQQSANSLSVIPDAEFQQIIQQFNNTNRSYPENTSIHELFELQVEKTPDEIAIVFGDQKLSYRELNRRANQLANAIRKLYQDIHAISFTVDTFVALYIERNAEFVISLLAVLKAGGAYLPISPSDPQKRVQHILTDTQAPIVLSQSNLEGQLNTIVEMVQTPCFILPVDDVDAFKGFDDENLPAFVLPNDLAYVIYTSGTTGVPKGTLVEHKGLVNIILHDIKAFGFEHGERIMHVLPMQFDAGGECLFHGICAGAQVHFTDPKSDLTAFMLAHEINYCAMTPMLLGAQVVREIPSLKIVMVGGDNCSQDLVNTWTNQCRMFNLYGPTECSVVSTMKELKHNQTPTIGGPVSNIHAYVLDHQLKPVPMGVTGELYLAGVGLARGYHNRPELTSNKFIANPIAGVGGRMYHSGDRARWLENGELAFAGREDHQVKVRGFRIEVQEIEHQISALEKISEAYVKVKGGNKQLVAYITLATPQRSEHSENDLATEINDHLDDYLPSHMLPSKYIVMDSMPLTPNGKLDESALPEPDFGQINADLLVPSTELELALCEIWQQVLGRDKVGLTDNFFNLGGDSISSIQLVTRANNQGIDFSVKTLFDNPTVAELVKVVKVKTADTREQKVVAGSISLLPIQRFYFKQNSEGAEHFNHSLLLNIPTTFAEQHLRVILEALYQRHDALRLVFEQNHEGLWQAQHIDIDEAFLHQASITQVKPEEKDWETWVEELCDFWQKSFDLQKGPLFKAIMLQEDNSQQSKKRLFLLFHHLVIDGVSWRILLDDLHLAYQQLMDDSHKKISLPNKTDSYQSFAAALSDFAESAECQAELSYWQQQCQEFKLPEEHQTNERPTIASTKRITFKISIEQTEQLLQQSNLTYRTHINELLLSAMYQGLCQWSGLNGVKFTFESHGREVPFCDLDMSQTLGWFTSFYPIYFTKQKGQDLKQAILNVKEIIRAVPNKGLGYGLLTLKQENEKNLKHDYQSVAFNYLGVFDANKQLASLGNNSFTEATEEVGEHQCSSHPRWHKLGLNGWVKQGQLSFTLDYSTLEYSDQNMQSLVVELKNSLLAVIDHCQHAEPCLTPSDYPLAKVKPVEFTRWQEQFSEMVDLYPATPMQQGMIFETLKEPRAYMLHQDIIFSANTDFNIMHEAWSEVMDHHCIMKTRFVGIESANIHQLVLPKGQFEWHQYDWSSLSGEDQELKWQAIIDQNYDRPFDFTLDPLTRLYLAKLSRNRWRLLFSQHHCLSDGWSLPIILGEVFSLAEHKSGYINYTLPPTADYKHYIEWFYRQSKEQGLSFWQSALQDISKPCLLMPTEQEKVNRQYCEKIVTFNAELSQKLNGYCRDNSTTLNTVMQLAWSYLLSQYTQSDNVVFGSIVSGRDCDVDGIQSMVGLFINTVPMVVHIDPKQSIADILQSLQKQQLETSQYKFVPLNDACMQAKNTGIKSGEQLFDTLLVTENYPTEGVLNSSNTLTQTTIEQATAAEHIDFGLSIAVVPADEYWVRFSYKSGEYNLSFVEQISQHFVTVIKSIISKISTSEGVGSLDMATQEVDNSSSLDTLVNELNGLSEAELAELLMAEENV